MSCNCGNSSSSSSSVAVQEQVNDIQTAIDSINQSIKFLTCGHPMIGLEDPDDIAQFDFTTGWGSNCWEGWAIMNGSSYYSPTLKKNIPTKNLYDNFLVGAGGTYAVGDTGGSNSVTLDLTQIPSHNHTAADSGHTHNITDTGHNHGIVDPQHSHGGTSEPHNHSIAPEPNHQHSIPEINESFSQGGAENKGFIWDADTLPTTLSGAAGAHNHGGFTGMSSIVISTNSVATGISVQNSFTGITETDSSTANITVNNSGGGLSHENRPPYIAILFVKKIY